MQQTLKFLVVFMGILILAGIAIIGVTIANRATSTVDSAPAAAGTAFASIALGLPQGSTVTRTDATDSRLILTVRLPDGTTHPAGPGDHVFTTQSPEDAP